MGRINVTKTFLPPISEYQVYLDQIWRRDQLTNQGPLLYELEAACKGYLGVSDFQFVSNGTIGLQLALRALDITEGEVITTAFSYVATVSSILWERCRPIFVDIDPDNFCIDATKIEPAITANTKAIMPVHVFGYACDVEKIEAIAKKHHLKVIYDGAHAFGVRQGNRSLLDYGDITMCSFHSTKLFHTIEGGCLIARDKTISDKLELMKRFGHNGDTHLMPGLNGKASEFQAAMGLCNLKYIDELIAKRKLVAERYDELLKGTIEPPIARTDGYNYAYYPAVFQSEAELIKVLKALEQKDVYARRYFYPALNTLPYIEPGQSCPIAEDISLRILCLPFHADLPFADVAMIAKTIREAISR